MPASPLVHRTVTALAVTFGVGALAASANGMRNVDGELAAAAQRTTPAVQEPVTSVRDGDVVSPLCDEKRKDTATPEPTPDASTTSSREL